MKPDRFKRLRNLLLFALSLIVLVLVSTYLYCAPCFHLDVVDRIVLHPVVVNEKQPILTGKGEISRPVTFPVKRNGKVLKLSGLLLKGEEPNGKVVLFSHGNSGCLDHRLGDYRVSILLKNFDVFEYDYEGYGRSQGEAHYVNLVDDAMAAYDFLRTSGYSQSNIVFYGESLGGGVTTELARLRRPAALILDCTFVSPEYFAKDRTWLARIYPQLLFPRPFFNNLDYLESTHPPCLIISGAQDGTIAPNHSNILSRGAKLLRLPESGHCILAPADKKLYNTGVTDWLTETNLRG